MVALEAFTLSSRYSQLAAITRLCAASIHSVGNRRTQSTSQRPLPARYSSHVGYIPRLVSNRGCQSGGIRTLAFGRDDHAPTCRQPSTSPLTREEHKKLYGNRGTCRTVVYTRWTDTSLSSEEEPLNLGELDYEVRYSSAHPH